MDSFLTRWAAGQAATLSTSWAMLLGRELTADDVEPLTWALAEIGARARARATTSTTSACTSSIPRMIAGWFDGGLDLLLTPTMAEPPPPLGTYDDSGDDPLDAFHRAWPPGAFTAIFNATGQPAISLPLHWTDDGLPVGVQLVAPFGREDLLIGSPPSSSRPQPWADGRPPVFAT